MKKRTLNSFVDQPIVLLPKKTQNVQQPFSYDQSSFLDGNIRRVNLGFYTQIKDIEKQCKNNASTITKLRSPKIYSRQAVYIAPKYQLDILSKDLQFIKNQKVYNTVDDQKDTQVHKYMNPLSNSSYQYQQISVQQINFADRLSDPTYFQIQPQNKQAPIRQQRISTNFQPPQSVQIQYIDENLHMIGAYGQDINIKKNMAKILQEQITFDGQEFDLCENQSKDPQKSKVIQIQMEQKLLFNNSFKLQPEQFDSTEIFQQNIVIESFVNFVSKNKVFDIIRHSLQFQNQQNQQFYIYQLQSKKFYNQFTLETYQQNLIKFEKVTLINQPPCQLLIEDGQQLSLNLNKLQALYLVRLSYDYSGKIIVALPKLQHLIFFQCQFEQFEIIYPSLIQTIIINNTYAITKFQTKFTQSLNMFSSLKFLQLNYIDILFMDLTFNSQIEYLEITNSNIEDIITLPNTLNYINFSSTRLKSCSPIYLLKQLYTLILINNENLNFNLNRVPQSVTYLDFSLQKQHFLPINFSTSQLKFLTLNKTGLESFVNMPVSLNTLKVQNNNFLNLHQIEKLQFLQTLDVSSNINIQNELWFMPNSIINLNLSNCGIQKVSDLRFLQNLKSLNLSYNQNIDIHKFAFPKQLKDLIIESCGLKQSPNLSRISDLQSLSLAGNTDIVILDLKVQNLNLSNCALCYVDTNRIENLQSINLKGNKIKFYFPSQKIHVQFEQQTEIFSKKNIPKSLMCMLISSQINLSEDITEIRFQRDDVISQIVQLQQQE
ncbi:hypothetical protein SS50377_21091 [Spironucleus salmonicida]|uniref:Leucine rich repeat-containing protein n=1 Tax=Spironucleus salmonicida TaxID=348837 RepID=A0A9P8M1K6_9EUKA|nr:hypothetical protein SS50377_21091 [Spironucleus salmonicida]